MDNFKFNVLLQDQHEISSIDKFFLTVFKILTILSGFLGNFIARMFCGNHLNYLNCLQRCLHP